MYPQVDQFLTLGPACVKNITIPEHSTKTETLADNIIGQTIKIQCWTGYEFPSNPVQYSAPTAAPSPAPLSPITLTESQWSNWGPWTLCSVTCGPGDIYRYRDCQVEGMCRGDFREQGTCDEGTCRKSTS